MISQLERKVNQEVGMGNNQMMLYNEKITDFKNVKNMQSSSSMNQL